MVELFEATLSTITQWNKGGAKGALHHSGDGFSLNNDKCFDALKSINTVGKDTSEL